MKFKKLLFGVITGAMVFGAVSLSAFAEDVYVDSLDELKAAQTTEAGNTVIVNNEIELDGGIVFSNPITFEIAEGGKLSYNSSDNAGLQLITLQGGSTFNLAENAAVVMNGDGDQKSGRNWYAVYSNGDMQCDVLNGDMEIHNARGAALYAAGSLTIKDMAADIIMDNPNGDNRNVIGIGADRIVSIDDLTGTIDIDFGKGNQGFGIISWYESVVVNNDITGSINVELGLSHYGVGIYANKNVTVKGDIKGEIYARGASGSGYAIQAATGDVAIANISGTVEGDCYNTNMENSQSGASAIYAAGSIYGSLNDEQYIPMELSGTLSSKVGRNDAYTVNAGDKVYINIAGGKIEAQSSYGASFVGLDPGYEPMSNNWGGAAVAVVGTDIHITPDGAVDTAVSVISQSESGTPVESPMLVSTATRQDASTASEFLYYAARGQKDDAKETANTMTDEQKALIENFDEILKNLSVIQVRNEEELNAALASVVDGDIIEVISGTYDDNINIDKAITLKCSEEAVFSGVISANVEGVVLDGININYTGINSEANGNLYGQIMINANNVQLKNCNIYAYYTEGSVNVGSALGVIHTNCNADIVMDNCVIQTNTMGIFPAMTSGAITNCTFKPLDEGDTRKSLAINGVSNTTISGNTFYGMRILPSGAVTVEDNKFYDFSGSSFYMGYYEGEPINISNNYWGTDEPDISKILGTSGKLYIEDYYTDSNFENLEYIKNMTQVKFGGSLDGATISEDNLTLSQDDETVTAWRGDITGGTDGEVTVQATKGEQSVKKDIPMAAVESDALFYVLVNAQPDGMVFTYSNTNSAAE